MEKHNAKITNKMLEKHVFMFLCARLCTVQIQNAYTRSFLIFICRHHTREALPRLDNYRNIMSIQAVNRPSLDELHNSTLPNKV